MSAMGRNGGKEAATQVDKSTYSEQAVKYITACIMSGEILPGEKVKEVDIAKKLSISRAPIREALQILVQEGLLTYEPQKGKCVTALTSQQIFNNYFTAGVLQGAAVANSINKFTAADFQKLEEIVGQMAALARREGNNIERLARLDDEFHAVLLSNNDNRLLTDLSWKVSHKITKSLLFKFWRNLYTGREIVRRHEQILAALRQPDPWIIEACIREHYMENGRRLSVFGIDSGSRARPKEKRR